MLNMSDNEEHQNEQQEVTSSNVLSSGVSNIVNYDVVESFSSSDLLKNNDNDDVVVDDNKKISQNDVRNYYNEVVDVVHVVDNDVDDDNKKAYQDHAVDVVVVDDDDDKEIWEVKLDNTHEIVETNDEDVDLQYVEENDDQDVDEDVIMERYEGAGGVVYDLDLILGVKKSDNAKKTDVSDNIRVNNVDKNNKTDRLYDEVKEQDVVVVNDVEDSDFDISWEDNGVNDDEIKLIQEEANNKRTMMKQQQHQHQHHHQHQDEEKKSLTKKKKQKKYKKTFVVPHGVTKRNINDHDPIKTSLENKTEGIVHIVQDVVGDVIVDISADEHKMCDEQDHVEDSKKQEDVNMSLLCLEGVDKTSSTGSEETGVVIVNDDKSEGDTIDKDIQLDDENILVSVDKDLSSTTTCDEVTTSCDEQHDDLSNSSSSLVERSPVKRKSILKPPSPSRDTPSPNKNVSFTETHSVVVYEEEDSGSDVDVDLDVDVDSEERDNFNSEDVNLKPLPPPVSSSPLQVFSADPLQPKFRRKTAFNSRKIFYPYDILRNSYPEDIDITKKELYLADVEFNELFGMKKDEYKQLPRWKADRLKKQLGLF